MAKKKDMRTRANKQHLGTAANRDAYEKQKSVIIKGGKPAEPAPKKGNADGNDR